MSDKFSPIPLPRLLTLVLSGIRNNRIPGIPGSLFFRPKVTDPFRMKRYGKVLETPVGIAAGPHTQLALNIVAAWLCGARYIELKTVQTLDELEVSKPCIDMQDEGYNCEWSQELKIGQSFDEYLNAWILIHILHRELGFEGPPGMIFNMSVGYNMEGILRDNVQWFFDRMQDCSTELAHARNTIRKVYPAIDEIGIPSRISDNITLSTMHGCPPEEIGKIGNYLLTEKRLHTTIKLNPTLIGQEMLAHILGRGDSRNHPGCGVPPEVPDEAFAHDLRYSDALNLIRSLSETAKKEGLGFGIKLTNTLETVNNRNVFNTKETMMYMSGRLLHPVSINVARKLQNDFGGNLDISFSGGVDCFNIAPVLACGLKPVTVCSDLLKPGGYGRLWQYMENLRTAFTAVKANSLDEFIMQECRNAGMHNKIVQNAGVQECRNVDEAALLNLNRYADEAKDDPAYKKSNLIDPDIKTKRQLGYFDCIHAPCKDTCPTNQDIPGYMYSVSQNDIPAAFTTIMDTNPFPAVTGMICDHPCQVKCTRINYDEPLMIREIKRFVAENHDEPFPVIPATESKYKVAIIGGGPAGLSCAWFLTKSGIRVDLFEQKAMPGGMVSAAIPSFRLTNDAIKQDISRILGMNAGTGLFTLHEKNTVTKEDFPTIQETHDAVFLAAGAQRSAQMHIEGIELPGVMDPLNFLFVVKKKNSYFRGKHVVIIGGGNTAMDAARTAYRLVGENGTVTIIYRRTIKEMPADKGEISAVLDEGIMIIELANPERILSSDGHVSSILCSRNILGIKGNDGRPAPIKVPGSEFEISCDTVIPAIGQELDIDFLGTSEIITSRGKYKTNIDGLYVGGDALRGASTAINAIADGRKAAEEIIGDLNIPLPRPLPETGRGEGVPKNIPELLHRKSVRRYGVSPAETPLDDRRNFNLVISSYSQDEAVNEASRCLFCDEICNVCVTVCPNLANFSYMMDPVKFRLQKAVLKADGSIGFEDDCDFSVEQRYQILNIRDLCNECGIVPPFVRRMASHIRINRAVPFHPDTEPGKRGLFPERIAG